MRAAPLVIYPEAAELARAMVDFERAGQRDTADRTRWLEDVEQLMSGWGVDVAEGRQALLVWLGRHRMGPPERDCPVDQRCLALALGHNRIASRTGSVSQRSCRPGSWAWQPPTCRPHKVGGPETVAVSGPPTCTWCKESHAAPISRCGGPCDARGGH